MLLGAATTGHSDGSNNRWIDGDGISIVFNPMGEGELWIQDSFSGDNFVVSITKQ